MVEKKNDSKGKQEQKSASDDVELENQFILRLPEEPAKLLREILQLPNSNLKERMTIQLDADLRYGEVRLDDWLLYAKVVDLPTIIESLKSIDNKNFYKTADICQMMICKEERHDLDKEESPNKGKKKDPNKVDKKFLWAHGITPPCKNIRKRRFRKTLKKKNVEAPEIEKEVKRLLRIDNDAVKVEFEIINEDVEKSSNDDAFKENQKDNDYPDDMQNEDARVENDSFQRDFHLESDGDGDAGGEADVEGDGDGDGDDDFKMQSSTAPISGLGEHDIFGEEVSSSSADDDDEETSNRNSRLRDLDDASRISCDDSRMSAFSMGTTCAGGNTNSLTGNYSEQSMNKNDINDFRKGMFGSPKSGDNDERKCTDSAAAGESSASNYFEGSKGNDFDDDSCSNTTTQMQYENIQMKISELRRQYDDIKAQRTQKAQEISSIQNPTLRQRMQETLDNLAGQMMEKELQIKDYENLL